MNRPCIDCGVPVTGTRCPACEAARPRRGGRRGRPSDPARNRSRAWRRLSAAARRSSPFCERCGASGDLTTDHVVPVSMGGRMFPGRGGLRVLCRSCNAAVLAEQRRASGQP